MNNLLLLRCKHTQLCAHLIHKKAQQPKWQHLKQTTPLLVGSACSRHFKSFELATRSTSAAQLGGWVATAAGLLLHPHKIAPDLRGMISHQSSLQRNALTTWWPDALLSREAEGMLGEVRCKSRRPDETHFGRCELGAFDQLSTNTLRRHGACAAASASCMIRGIRSTASQYWLLYTHKVSHNKRPPAYTHAVHWISGCHRQDCLCAGRTQV